MPSAPSSGASRRRAQSFHPISTWNPVERSYRLIGLYSEMDDRTRFTDLRQQNNRLKADFISTELSLAITFCKIALSSTNQVTSNRNVQHARRAYESACRALEGSFLQSPARETIAGELRQLEDLLKRVTEADHAPKTTWSPSDLI